MGDFMRYDRENAVNYAKKWALSRNLEYLNYDNLGGDCTNFVSQCLFAGIVQMNFRGYGWYYIDGNNKSPSWTGVRFLYEFLINNRIDGPKGRLVTREQIEIGDVIQLSFKDGVFGHSLIISSLDEECIRVCAHTIDSKDRLLDTYNYQEIRYIKIS